MRRAELAAICALDAAVGDPRSLPHPVSAIGSAVAAVDRRRRATARVPEMVSGALLAGAVVAASAALAHAASRSGTLARIVVGASTLAGRSLLEAGERVGSALDAGDLPAARAAVAQIVGRDVDELDESGVARAVLEALAESLGDGVAAPLLALRLGGCAAAMAFKAVSTMDSMIGHREAPYTWFGLVAARADDVANLIPSRCAAVAIAVAALLAGDDGVRAAATAWRDARYHASPNAGWPEAALAGALGVRLGGTNRYGGVAVAGAVFNRAGAAPLARDVRRALRLIAVAIVLLEAAAIASARA
jgi:adenosylcobinamide-phosphate synthase